MSLQSRILAAFAIVLVTFIVTALIVLSSQESMLVRQVDDRLMTVNPGQIAALQSENAPFMSSSGGVPTGEEPPRIPILDVYIGGTNDRGEIDPLIYGSQSDGEPNLQRAVDRVRMAPGIVTVDDLNGNTRYRALVLPQPDGEGSYVVAQSLAGVDATMERLRRTLVIAGAILALMLGLVWFWIQRLGLRPIARVTSVAEAIALGDRTSRVPVMAGQTEAGKLGLAFNLMLDERDAGEQRLRQFVADASHELRTPLTSIRGYLDLVRQGAFRRGDQLDDVVRRLSAETSRMNELVEDMLILASLDEGRPLRITPVALGRLLEDAAQDARAVQPNRQITVNAEGDGPVVQGDESLADPAGLDPGFQRTHAHSNERILDADHSARWRNGRAGRRRYR